MSPKVILHKVARWLGVAHEKRSAGRPFVSRYGGGYLGRRPMSDKWTSRSCGGNARVP